MKFILGIAALCIIGVIGFIAWSPASAPSTLSEQRSTTNVNEASTQSETMEMERSVVADGEYTVDATQSIVNWAGQKPLIDGYINRGSIAVSAGSISVADTAASGSFTIDMNTLSVSDTPKPGKESSLESHLKGERWFNVAAHPDASFTITAVTPRADSDTTFIYDVVGELTMKGVTDTLTFPATIYQDANGTLYASADFEFDRTTWGITSGSASFFDNLADNAVDDMVALSFDLVAKK